MDQFIDWVYSQLVGFFGNFFAEMGNMGVELFEMSWVQSIVLFFSYLAWTLYVVGLVVAVFDILVFPWETAYLELPNESCDIFICIIYDFTATESSNGSLVVITEPDTKNIDFNTKQPPPLHDRPRISVPDRPVL